MYILPQKYHNETGTDSSDLLPATAKENTKRNITDIEILKNPIILNNLGAPPQESPSRMEKHITQLLELKIKILGNPDHKIEIASEVMLSFFNII